MTYTPRARAIVNQQRDPATVAIALGNADSDGELRDLIQWGPMVRTRREIGDQDSEPSWDDWLRLTPWEARALYDALAEHYGHTANDVRLLRRDYEHERGRLDKMTDAVLEMLRKVGAP